MSACPVVRLRAALSSRGAAASGMVSGFALPAAFAMVGNTPAEAIGLSDRGEIAVGKRADLLQIQIAETMPVIRPVWRAGRQVA